MDEQKAKKAVANATNPVQLIDQRHRYATRFATVVDSVVSNALVSNNVLNVQP